MPYITGDNDITSMVVPWSSIVEHSELVVMFGGAHSKNMQIDAGGAAMHENAGWIARAAYVYSLRAMEAFGELKAQ